MNQFFVNDDGRFRDASSWSGDGLLLARVSQGSAAVEIDEDGDLDLAAANNVGSATLLRNDLEGDHGWLQVSLIGPAHGVGAIVEVDPIPTGNRQNRQVCISGGYLSSDDVRLHFGLGTTATPR